jgi:response regulator RpfG family c-di-GMP phosphodiesterase
VARASINPGAGFAEADGGLPAQGKDTAVTRKPQVLVIDDDRPLCELLRTTFELEGFHVFEAHHVIEAERQLARSRPDAIVLDIGLPGIDGLFYCARLREAARTQSLPVVVISGSDEAGRSAEAAGASAFMRKPFNPLELLGLVETQIGRLPLSAAVEAAAPDDPEHAADLRRLIEIGQHQHELLDQAYRQTVTALAAALESRDFGTSEHSRRVTSYATRLTLEVEASLLDDPSLEWGFLLHDVGKIGIPDGILLKSGRLSGKERRRMQQHAVIGEQLLAHVPLLKGEGLRIIRSHHERWDGAGYPDQLATTQTPLGARIFSVVDALDAMTDDRPYRQALSWDAAVVELRRGSGGQFDPDVIDAVSVCEPDLYRIHHRQLAA